MLMVVEEENSETYSLMKDIIIKVKQHSLQKLTR